MSDKQIPILENVWLVLVLPMITSAVLFLVFRQPFLIAQFFLLLLLGSAWLVSRSRLQIPILKLIAFFLPFSVEVPLFGNSMIFLPTEPLIGIVAISVFIDFLRIPGYIKQLTGRELRWAFPLLTAFLITIPFSVMPVVSLKFSLVNITYMLVFLFVVNYHFRSDPKLFPQLIAHYTAGLLFVFGYALIRYHDFGWNPAVVKGIFLPFYRDHTIFGATAAIIGTFWLVHAGNIKAVSGRMLAFIAGLIFLSAVILSGSRAAIISIGFFLPVWLLLWLRAHMKHLIVITIVAATFMIIFQHKIIDAIYRNTYESRSQNTEWSGNLLSAGNVTTDVSNIERLNRWYSGIKMFFDKPATGFGPGTYQFVYIPYQKKELMNRLTVRNPWNIPENSGGTAHSEYILALSEMGIIGFTALLLFLGRLFWIVFTRARIHPHRPGIVTAFAALSTYIFHALFNNFLNIDKFAFLFWIIAAYLLAVYERKHDESILFRS
jgi:putative inorganic carbon (hco3(-)) transporter